MIGYNKEKISLELGLNFPYWVPSVFESDTNPYGFPRITGALLYGPPGTGKTQLAKAAARQVEGRLVVCLKSSDINSQYHGQTERNISCLFEMLEEMKPVLLLVDEAESVFGDRLDGSNSPVTKKAISMFLDLLQKQKGIFLLACTNAPWEINDGILRRLPKKIFIDLPDCHTRSLQIKFHLQKLLHAISDEEITLVANETESFTGSDLQDLIAQCSESAIYRLTLATYFKPCQYRPGKFVPCQSSDPGAEKTTWENLKIQDNIVEPVLEFEDLLNALNSFKARGPRLKKKYIDALEDNKKTKF